MSFGELHYTQSTIHFYCLLVRLSIHLNLGQISKTWLFLPALCPSDI